MSDLGLIKEIKHVVTIPIMAKDESGVLIVADDAHHIK